MAKTVEKGKKSSWAARSRGKTLGVIDAGTIGSRVPTAPIEAGHGSVRLRPLHLH